MTMINFKEKLKGLFKSVKDGYFNEKWTCNGCSNENFTDGYFCQKCQETLPVISQDFCEHCGRKTPFPTAFCNSCIEKNINFEKARSLYEYKEPINNLLRNFKYDGDKYIANIFVKDLANKFYENFSDADFFTAIPMTSERLKSRGYNQSFILADKLSKYTKIPCVSALKKVKDTERQATLSADERKKNLKGSFKAVKNLVKDKTVVLVDDVLTTGATADVCSEILKKAGAKKVYVLTVATVTLNKML